MKRTCKTCNIEKSIEGFIKKKECIFGYTHRCRKCHNDAVRKIPLAKDGEQFCRKCELFLPLKKLVKNSNCSSGYRYLCKKCKNKMYVKKGRFVNKSSFKEGELHPNYIDGKWKERSLIGRNKRFRRVRKLVMERDGHCCTMCDRDDILHVHHIVPLRVDVKLAYDMDNLITLCPQCHVDEDKRMMAVIV